MATKKKEAQDRLRLRIKAYDSKLLDASCKQIIDTAKKYDAEVVGPTPLPTEFHRYTVNRSTFIDKNSREQFEMRIHKRIVDILNATPAVIESLSSLNLPAGVDIAIK
ncbi:MAG: 30S ribosomal protein S10, partial [Candidatus Harrisonbacteria bacterium CG10_big_fil_rev_8_21_14_0_10_45_28]